MGETGGVVGREERLGFPLLRSHQAVSLNARDLSSSLDSATQYWSLSFLICKNGDSKIKVVSTMQDI